MREVGMELCPEEFGLKWGGLYMYLGWEFLWRKEEFL